MLTKKDLQLIGEVIDANVPPIVERIIDLKVPPIIEKILDSRVPPIVERIIDLKVPVIVEKIVGIELSDFAAMVQNGFSEINTRFNLMEEKLDKKADKADIVRLKNKFESRICKLEDGMRLVKTKLKIA